MLQEVWAELRWEPLEIIDLGDAVVVETRSWPGPGQRTANRVGRDGCLLVPGRADRAGAGLPHQGRGAGSGPGLATGSSAG